MPMSARPGRVGFGPGQPTRTQADSYTSCVLMGLVVGTDILDAVPPWAIVIFCCAVLLFGLSSVLSRPTSVRLREAILWTVIALVVLGGLTQEEWVVLGLIFAFVLLVIWEVARQIRRHVVGLENSRVKKGAS